MKIKFFNDRLTLWVISGVIGSVIREIFDSLIIWTGLSRVHIVYLSVDLFTNNPKEIHSFLGLAIGTFTDWVLGAFIGVIVGLVLQWTGHKNYLLKGIGVGLFSWVAIFGFIVHGFPQMFTAQPKCLSDVVYSFLAHVIFGGTTAFFNNKFVPAKMGDW